MADLFKRQANLQQIGPHSYTTSHDADWTVGPTLHGGSVAAVIHLAATTHFATTLKKYNQPDVLTLHIEFLRYCVPNDLEITITDLKRGAVHCTIQLQLSQEGQLKAIATATSTNFNEPLGPTVTTDWILDPPPKPTPNFAKIKASEPDENWIPGRIAGEVIPISRHMLVLSPRGGFPVAGMCEAWNGFTAEAMDATCVTLLCDMMPSMSDTLLRNGGMYDAHSKFATMEKWAEKNPGVVCEMTNSLAEAADASLFENTLSMNIEFKKRIPEAGLQWAFTRATTKKMDGGRMDLDITICDEQMELICNARQVILVLDAKKRFRRAEGNSKM
ncbi:hypothetical protein AK830_g252 [Neonectria ditissima]|uniref:Thioesterase domain-containing protein n=1 Tax=Neonectria ditissima TaxID=78410 RepID=A0A0P7BX74_9HYPO|nr:hypothetical protein AK830_g252 [Neonectria ditissima]